MLQRTIGRLSKEFTDTQGRSILLACAELVGGIAALAKHLNIPEEQLAAWVAGRAIPPPDIVVKAGDAVISLSRKK